MFGIQQVTDEQHWAAFHEGRRQQRPHTFQWVWESVMPWGSKPFEDYKFGELASLHASYSAGWLHGPDFAVVNLTNAFKSNNLGLNKAHVRISELEELLKESE